MQRALAAAAAERLNAAPGKAAQVDIGMTPRVLKAIVLFPNCLKVQCCQAVGFTYQPAPLQPGSGREGQTPNVSNGAAAGAAQQQHEEEDPVEVYANGIAFEVVKSWLGESGKDLDWRAWYGDERDRAPHRPERLGLGGVELGAG